MNFFSYLKLTRYYFLKNNPAQVIFFVTARCNMKCKMCFYWRNIDSSDLSGELTFDEIASISGNMNPFFWLMIGGGEPFLREDLADICGVFYKNNRVRNITIPTNGFDRDKITAGVEKILKRIGGTYLNVNFSIDGIGAGHDDIRGVKGAFERVTESFKAVKGLKSSYANLGVAVNIVHSAFNEEGIVETLEYIIKSLQPDNLALVLVRGNPRNEEMSRIDMELYRKSMERITSAVIEGELQFYDIPFRYFIYAKDILMHRIIYNTKKTGRCQIPCFAGRLSIVISESGNVFPCELKDTPLGNLRGCGYDLSRILTRDKIDYLKKEIQQKRCFCTHECFYTMNILFNPMQYPSLLKEWIRLRSWKLYAAIR